MTRANIIQPHRVTLHKAASTIQDVVNSGDDPSPFLNSMRRASLEHCLVSNFKASRAIIEKEFPSPTGAHAYDDRWTKLEAMTYRFWEKKLQLDDVYNRLSLIKSKLMFVPESLTGLVENVAKAHSSTEQALHSMIEILRDTAESAQGGLAMEKGEDRIEVRNISHVRPELERGIAEVDEHWDSMERARTELSKAYKKHMEGMEGVEWIIETLPSKAASKKPVRDE